MSVYRVRDKWRAEVYIEGERVTDKSGFESKKAAKKWHDEQLALFKKNPELSKPREETMEDLVKRIEAYVLPAVRGRTKLRYELEIRERIRPNFRFMKLSRLTGEQIEAFKAELAKTLKPKTANFSLWFLAMMLRKAVKWRMLEQSPSPSTTSGSQRRATRGGKTGRTWVRS